MRSGIEGNRRSQASRRFLIQHGGVAEAQLDSVAAAAFDAYSRFRSRIFDRAAFSLVAGEESVRALELSNTMLSNADGTSYFVHHLIHDYLAARHVASWHSRQPDATYPRRFSSFDASSFDAVELVFEQLDGKRADQFLRQLYDWNLYAAGYALAQSQDRDASASVEMRTMIFAMLAEKRFDPVLTTRQRADDALALMQLSDAKPFRDAHGLIDEIFEVLDAIQI